MGIHIDLYNIILIIRSKYELNYILYVNFSITDKYFLGFFLPIDIFAETKRPKMLCIGIIQSHPKS